MKQFLTTSLLVLFLMANVSCEKEDAEDSEPEEIFNILDTYPEFEGRWVTTPPCTDADGYQTVMEIFSNGNAHYNRYGDITTTVHLGPVTIKDGDFRISSEPIFEFIKVKDTSAYYIFDEECYVFGPDVDSLYYSGYINPNVSGFLFYKMDE